MKFLEDIEEEDNFPYLVIGVCASNTCWCGKKQVFLAICDGCAETHIHLEVRRAKQLRDALTQWLETNTLPVDVEEPEGDEA